MDIKIKFEELFDFGNELFLQNLLLATKIKNNLLNKGDLSGAEKIDREVISVYEKMYEDINLEKNKFLEEENKESYLAKLEENLNKILENSGFSKTFIEEKMKLRRSLAKNSGSEVVKKFYSYQLKEYRKILDNFILEMNRILDKEEKLNLELSNEVQEKNQLKIIQKLQPIIKKSRNLTEKIEKYNKKIIEINEIIAKKWTHEIYGTLDKNELLTTFSNFYSQK